MLELIDSSKHEHMIMLANLNHVVFRKHGDVEVISFHMRDQHVLPITVTVATAAQIRDSLRKAGVTA